MGSKAAGAGRFGQLDLNGNRFEWSLDAEDPKLPASEYQLPVPCQDCAKDESAAAFYRVHRNVSFFQVSNGGVGKLMTTDGAERANVAIGLRCARDLP
ncbi:MAG: hypothetical protein ACMG6S_36450 [Byssovorax sp.]